MGAVATFDYAAWLARYPEFGPSGQQPVSADQAAMYFAEATDNHRNDGFGPVEDATTQLRLLNMLTAHIAVRNAANANGSPASGLVGRISSATEGSVSVSTDAPGIPASAAWLAQTKYGLDYWNATKSYRTARYRARPTRVINGPYPFFRQ
jgi:hypothetical protein